MLFTLLSDAALTGPDGTAGGGGGGGGGGSGNAVRLPTTTASTTLPARDRGAGGGAAGTDVLDGSGEKCAMEPSNSRPASVRRNNEKKGDYVV